MAHSTMSLSPDVVVSCALQHYKSLPNHGKPREGQEWTVYAALVVSSSIDKYVLCSATGSKCTTTGPEGWCLRDLHAEVLVKRGFQRLLWKEIRSGNLKLLCKLPSDEMPGKEGYALRNDIQLHLFISDSPCGDATIYELNNGDINFTGAKLIGDADGELSCWNSTTVTREETQQLGQLRIKSGRSNLPSHLRSTSLSCSDKLLKWNLLGLQGSLLPVHPVYLDSIVVSRDPHSKSIQAQQQALERAVLDRRQQVIKDVKQKDEFCKTYIDFLSCLEKHQLTISVVDQVFDSAKSQLVTPFQPPLSTTNNDSVNKNGKRTMDTTTANNNSKQSKKKKVSPCGFCLNWQQDDGVEVLVGGRGTRQGKKPTTDADYAKQASRLCRRGVYQLGGATTKTYCDWKQSAAASREKRKQAVFQTNPLQGWIKSDRDFSL